MSRKKGIWLGVGGVVLVAVVVALLLFQPWLIWIDEEGNEADDPSRVVGTASDGLSDTSVPSASGTEQTRIQLAAGDFIDAEHDTSGRAVVYRRSDGSRYLRLDDFVTSNGPDVHVWITDRPSGGDCEGCSESWGIYDDGDYVRLGPMKFNEGNQNYEIPDDADLAGMRSVVIWCDRFNVAFGTAAIG